MSTWWQVSAFTKAEWFEHGMAPFFRAMGQIPLRRGDEQSTEWAMQMCQEVLDGGWKLGIYPEGTRSPDPDALHKLHKRILIPLLAANPDVPGACGVRAVPSQDPSAPAEGHRCGSRSSWTWIRGRWTPRS